MEKCKLCQDDVMDTRFGVCFDCASAQEIIGEQILQEEKPIRTNAIIKGLAEKGYIIVERKFVERARKSGIERDEIQ